MGGFSNTLMAALFTILLLSGCTVDMNAGKRPYDQNNTRWVSEDPKIYFEVSDHYSEITGSNTYGVIEIGGVATEIAVSFDYGKGVEFRPISAYHTDSETGESYIDGDAWLFLGTCKFNPNKLTVKIFNNSRGFLPDTIKKITFVKEEGGAP